MLRLAPAVFILFVLTAVLLLHEGMFGWLLHLAALVMAGYFCLAFMSPPRPRIRIRKGPPK